jgi:hypothetical protein
MKQLLVVCLFVLVGVSEVQGQEVTIVTAGPQLSAYYHENACALLPAAGTSVTRLTRSDATARGFRPHDACELQVYLVAGGSSFHRRNCPAVAHVAAPVPRRLSELSKAYWGCEVCKPLEGAAAAPPPAHVVTPSASAGMVHFIKGGTVYHRSTCSSLTGHVVDSRNVTELPPYFTACGACRPLENDPAATSTHVGSSDGSSATGGGTVHVRGYRRKDGTYVRPHTRKAPRR